MSLTKGPDDLICSARKCERAAEWAIIWSNPAIHYGRHKTWLACDEHKDFLKDYLSYRKFPTKVEPIAQFLLNEQQENTDVS